MKNDRGRSSARRVGHRTAVVVLVVLTAVASLTLQVPSGASEPASPPTESKIVNGKPASQDGHPWLVALLRSSSPNNTTAQYCGGALVAPKWVVTAAHCVAATQPGSLDLLVGATDLSTTTRPRIRANRIVVHPNYQSSNLRNDIALVEMTSAVTTPTIDVIGLGENSLWVPGTISTLRGWGKTEDTNSPADLRQADIPRLSDPECHTQLDGTSENVDYDESVMLCAGETEGTERMDACAGDSGSPLVVPDTNRAVGAVAIGLVSWGPGCGQAPSGYTRLEVYAGWVADTIAQGPPNPPEFPDIGGSVHAPNIRRIAAAGITTGFADGTYRPLNPVERGQMASFIDRAIEFIPPEANRFASEPSPRSDDSKVWHGDPAADDAYPYMTAIAPRGAGAAQTFCGGTHITSTYVLTAAHCVENVAPSAIELYVGTTDLSSPGPAYLADRIVTHHDWSMDTFADDIALIHLTSAPPSAPMPIVRAGDESSWQAGATLTLLGWGKLESGEFPSRLRQAGQTRMSDAACEQNEQQTTIEFNAATHLCATGEGATNRASACEGDSGGPLIASTTTGLAQAGIVSFGPNPECNAAPTRYTRVAEYPGWIDEVSAGYFSDTYSSVHRAAIHSIVDQGVATGFPDHTFRPTDSVTRGQMATFLAQALNLPTASDGPFTDVGGTVHRDSINRLVAAGITNGYTDNTFRPELPVSREQMATFLVAAGLA